MATVIVRRKLVCLGAVLVALGLVIAVGIPGADSPFLSDATRRSRVEDVVAAFRSYVIDGDRNIESTHRDTDGKPLCSWRFVLGHAMVGHGLEYECETPWYSPDNYAVFDSSIGDLSFLFCFYQNRESPTSLDTSVAAATGPGTVFDGQPHTSGDLPVDLILFLEVRDSGTHWMEPGGDVDVRAVPDDITKGLAGKGLHVAFADGEVWFLSSSVPLDDLKKFFTIAGAKKYDRGELLEPYRRDE